jgi:hypothetical protein
MERSEDVRVLHQQIEFLEAENERLRKDTNELCDKFERIAERCTLGYQVKAAAGRFCQDILYWKFVVLMLVIEAVRFGMEPARRQH